MYVGANGQIGLQAAMQEARSCTGLNIISYHIIVCTKPKLCQNWAKDRPCDVIKLS